MSRVKWQLADDAILHSIDKQRALEILEKGKITYIDEDVDGAVHYVTYKGTDYNVSEDKDNIVREIWEEGEY